jgi:predicted hydrolase (HD superfamily)
MPGKTKKENRPMPDSAFSRERAWSLLNEHTQSLSLIKHALAVETCVRSYAQRYADSNNLAADDSNALIDLWSATALLHDFDYEKHPSQTEHPFVGIAILAEQGWPEEMRTAILGHAEYSGVARQSPLAIALFACDELAGFLTACSLVKPTKSIHDVDVAGVKKKMKDKAFARGVNRDDIVKGASELGIPIEDHIANCIAAMQSNAEALGLQGAAPQI